MILAEPLDVMVERVEASGGHHPRLTHRTTEAMLEAPRALDELVGAGEHRTQRRTEPLREVDPHRVDPAAPARRIDAGCDHRVHQPRTVDVDGHVTLVRGGDALHSPFPQT